jgi:hypothetical protein
VAFEAKWDVYKITEFRDGCVYKTKKITSIWLPVGSRDIKESNEIAKQHGGDQLISTTESRVTSKGRNEA